MSLLSLSVRGVNNSEKSCNKQVQKKLCVSNVTTYEKLTKEVTINEG